MRMKSICPNPLLRQGISLGVKASTTASVLFWGVYAVLGGINTRVYDPYGVAALLAIATMVVMLVPAAIGGATNACILYQLSSRVKLTRTTSILTGLLVGFMAGLLPIAGMLMTGDDLELDAADVEGLSLMACIATLSGGWHGWTLGRRLIKTNLGRSGTGQ